MFFCSHGTAENKYLKVPQISDDSHRVQNAAYTQVQCYVCASVAVTSELGNNKSCLEKYVNLPKIEKRQQTWKFILLKDD